MDMIFLCILGLIGLALFLVWIYSLILKQRNLARIDKIIQQCEDKLYKKVKKAEFAEEGENAVENTRILVEQGVVELRGKDRKTEDDDNDE